MASPSRAQPAPSWEGSLAVRQVWARLAQGRAASRQQLCQIGPLSRAGALPSRRRREPPPGSRVNGWRGGEPPPGKKRQPSLVWLKPYLAGAECASRTAELQLCSEARSGRVAGSRLLCPGRALPRLASMLGFLPRKEPAARGWETALATSWPQLCSCLAVAPRPQASFERA